MYTTNSIPESGPKASDIPWHLQIDFRWPRRVIRHSLPKDMKSCKLKVADTNFQPFHLDGSFLPMFKCRGGSRIFSWRVADTKRPPNYTLIYFKLSYVCPKTWRFMKDELETITLQTLETYFYIFWDPRISVCFPTYYIFLVHCSKGGWLATQSSPSLPLPPPPLLDRPLKCFKLYRCFGHNRLP